MNAAQSLFLLMLSAAAPMLQACAHNVDAQGHVKLYDSRDKIAAGSTTREEVLQLMGTPSSVSTFGQERWYYISTKKDTVAFFKPKVVEQQVLALTFAPDGVVEKVENYSGEDARAIGFSRDKTPAEGKSFGLMEQLIGNLGRFNKGQGTGADPARMPRNDGRR